MRSVIKKFFSVMLVLVLAFWFASRPQRLAHDDLPTHQPDPANGESLFYAGGCVSCHGEGLGGGLEMESPYGVFRVPNISPDKETGIGNWTALQFVNAMQKGVSPDGRHYYPAFPYTSYTRMTIEDTIDLKAYMDSLSPVSNRTANHELHFPWNFRRGIGLWKRRYLDPSPVLDTGGLEAVIERGRYLAEGPGHCAECHTPRDKLGGLQTARWLAGGANPEGEGTIPNITPHSDGLASWSAKDIAYYLQSGFTPDFDTVGGSMVEVQENMAHLADTDLAALAAYLKAIPARPKTAEE